MSKKVTPNLALLRTYCDNYTRNQKNRIATGEQIRAIVQGRDPQNKDSVSTDPNHYKQLLANQGFIDVVDDDGKVKKKAEDMLLEAILRDQSNYPDHYLAKSYRFLGGLEELSNSYMRAAVKAHPAYSWAIKVRGTGDTLLGMLLSRLDINKAPHNGHFVSYCGLGTVPGQRWECKKCGHVGIYPATYNVTGKHSKCKQLAIKTHGPQDGIRAAQPEPQKGEKLNYDKYLKKTMYLICTSFIKSGPKSFYENMYRKKVEYYKRNRIGWDAARIHLSAIRFVGKIFLSHLHEAWSLAINRQPGPLYEEVILGHTSHDIVHAYEVLEFEKGVSN